MYNGLLHNFTHVHVQSLQTSCLICSLAPSPTPQLSSLAVLQYHLASELEWGDSVQHVGLVQRVHNVVYTLYITCTPGDSDTWNLCTYKQVSTYFTICKLKLESKVLWNLEYPSNGENFRKHKSTSTIIITMQKPPEATTISILYVFKSSMNEPNIQTPNSVSNLVVHNWLA